MATEKTMFFVQGRQFEVESFSTLSERELKLIRYGIIDAFALCEQDELHPSTKEFLDAISLYSNVLPQKIRDLRVVH